MSKLKGSSIPTVGKNVKSLEHFSARPKQQITDGCILLEGMSFIDVTVDFTVLCQQMMNNLHCNDYAALETRQCISKGLNHVIYEKKTTFLISDMICYSIFLLFTILIRGVVLTFQH